MDVKIDLTNLDKKFEGEIQFFIFDPQKYGNTGKALKKNLPVFYNPVQELNRSISMVGFKAFHQLNSALEVKHPFLVCDCMAASGIRSLRLKKYLDPKTVFVINDLNPLAIEMIKENARLNKIDLSSSEIYNEGANFLFNLMRKNRKSASIIDIDPFGSPNLFIENAVRALTKNGLLGITATDTAVFFGIRKDACKKKYNTTPLRSSFLKEVGLRILLYFVATRAHPLNRSIKPLLSLSFDHYVRLFVQIGYGKKSINQNLSNIGFIYWCPKCDWRSTSNLNPMKNFTECPNCDANIQYGGPLWLGKLHNQEFIDECETHAQEVSKDILPSQKKILKVLNITKYEDNFPIGYYDIHKLCDLMNISVSSMAKILLSIKNTGFNAALTHINPKAIKTDIPLLELKDILKNLAKNAK